MTHAEHRTDDPPAHAELVPQPRTDDAPRVPEPRPTDEADRAGAAALEELENRVAALERLVWGRRDDAVALDVTDPELRRLATTAETGHELAARLAGPDIRSACERAIAAWDEWHRRHYELLGAALTASHTIAVTSADQRGRTRAVTAFRTARTELATLAGQRQGYLNAAIHARRQLDHDQLVRDRHQSEIEAGLEAWVSLLARLRMRMAAAVEHGEPMPGWLVLALGPPSVSSPSAWRELASDLLAYRITYGITGGVEPLGPAPTSEHSPRRRRWHAELVRCLTDWRDAAR